MNITFSRNHLILMLIFLLSNSCNKEKDKCCQCLENNGTSDFYDYPLTPNSPEWKNLKTEAEMYQACQIPSNILKSMCSIGLIDSWFKYPLLFNVFAWTTPQMGMDKMRNNFNGLNELFLRSDIGLKLFNKYKQFDPSGYDPNWSSADKGKYAIDLFVLELTQAQTESINTLTSIERKDVVREALKKREKKETDSLYNSLSDTSDAYLMARIMLHENFAPFVTDTASDNNLKIFTDTCLYQIPLDATDPKLILKKIINNASIFIQN